MRNLRFLICIVLVLMSIVTMQLLNALNTRTQRANAYANAYTITEPFIDTLDDLQNVNLRNQLYNAASDVRYGANDRHMYTNDSGWSFLTATGRGDLLERMRILPQGNVGIGTTDPSTKLDIYVDSADGSNQLKISDPKGSVYIAAGEGAAEVRHVNSKGESTSQYWLDANGAHVFRSSGTERMIIDENGNVGIGHDRDSKPTPSKPGVKLDVKGTIAARAASGTNLIKINPTTNTIDMVAGGKICFGNKCIGLAGNAVVVSDKT